MLSDKSNLYLDWLSQGLWSFRLNVLSLSLRLSLYIFSTSNPLWTTHYSCSLFFYCFGFSQLAWVVLSVLLRLLFQSFQKLLMLLPVHYSSFPVFFFSLQDFSPEYWHWLTWNPLVHFIELARYACYESYGDSGVSFSYAAGSTFVFFFFAACLYHLNWKGILSRWQSSSLTWQSPIPVS